MTYECSCDSGDAAEFFTSYTVKKARKQFRCEECRGHVLPGDSYRYSAGRWDGNFMDHRHCDLCEELQQWARISAPCFCYNFGDLHNEAQEMARAVDEEAPGVLAEYQQRIYKINKHNKDRRAVMEMAA